MRKIYLFILFCLFFANTYAQLSTVHYIPPLTTFNEKGSVPRDQYLYISTPSTASFDVTITPVGGIPIIKSVSNVAPVRFDIGIGFGTQLFVAPSVTAHKIVNKGFIVEALEPVFVSVRLNASTGNSQAGQIVSKGIAGLGTTFRLGHFINGNGAPVDYSSLVSVMASEDNTTINFSDFNSGVKIHNNGPTSIVLNKGESYIILLRTNLVTANRTGLIGVEVSSNKPIVVSCGSFTGSNHPTQLGGRDIGIDQIVPFERTGTEYVFIKGNGDDLVERVLIVAHEDATEVYKDNGVFIGTLNAGDFLTLDGTDYSPSNNLYVSTSKKVFAYQGIGGSINNANQGMFFVPPLSCQTPKTIDNIPFINKVGNRSFNGVVTIITETGAVVTVNGLAISTAPKAIIGNADFVTYVVTGLVGNVSVASDRQVYLASYGTSGAATFGGYYSGFIFEPKIILDTPLVSASNTCIPNVELSLFDNAFYDSYQWFFNGNIIPGANSETYTPLNAGYYQLEGVISGCSDTILSENIPVSFCPADFDGDEVGDNIDVDLDNDGILNSEESYGDFLLDVSNVLTGSLAIVDGPTINYTGIISKVNNTVASPIVGIAAGVITSEVSANDGNNLSEVSYEFNTDMPINIQFEYVGNSVITDGQLDDQEYFVIKVPTDKTITVLDPDNQLLIDVNYDGVFDDIITVFSAFEICFKLKAASLSAGAGTFKFKSHSVTKLSYTHINESETAGNKVSFKISITDVGRDTDLDNVSNAMDADSDGDGCSDVVEAGFMDVNGDNFLGGTPLIVDDFGRVTSGADGYTSPSSNYIVLPVLVIDVQPEEFIDGCQAAGTFVEVTVANADSYQWQKKSDGGITWEDIIDDTLYSGATTNKLIFTNLPLSANLTKYRVHVIGAGNGCGLLSNEATLTVAPYVTSTFITVGPICIGDILNPLPTTSVEFMTGTWSPVLNNTVSTTYTFTPTDGQCTNPVFSTMEIVVHPLPTVIANTNTTTICSGESVILTGSGAVTYVWDNGVVDGTSFVPTVTKTYTVIGTGVNGCKNQAAITITVNPLPTILANADTTSICIGESVILKGTGGISYIWDNGVIDGTSFIPTETNTYTVIGTDINGCENMATVTVTVNSLPIVVANVDNTTICLGESVTLTGSGAVNYSWDHGIVDGTSFIPAETNTYTVIGTDLNGCENIATVTVTVKIMPIILANATNTTICLGESVILSGSGGISYVWDNGVVDGTSFIPTATKTYTVIGTGVNGCENTATVTVTVKTMPIILANATNTTICLGESVILEGSGAVTYVWDNGVVDGTSFIPTETNTYTVIGTDINGCGNTATVTVTVNLLPIVVANADNNAICLGGSVTLTGSGAVNYSWDNGVIDGNSFIPTETNTYTVIGTDVNGCENTATVTVTVKTMPIILAYATNTTICSGESVILEGSGGISYIWDNGVVDGTSFIPTETNTYTVIGTDINGCENIATVTISVNPLPIVVANADNNTICLGESVTLTGSGAVNYSWDKGVIDGTSFIPTETKTYTVIGTDINGCENMATVTVTVHPLPIVVANADNNTICLGESVNLTGSGAVNYSWDHGVVDGTSFIPAETNTYTVIGTDVNGCENTATVTVTVKTMPVIFANATNTTICSGESVILTGSGAVTYVWDNGVVDGTSFIPTATNTYTVIGTGVNGCENQSAITITVNPSPTILANADTTSICIGESVTLTGTGGISYIWDKGVVDGTSFIPTETKIYTVIGTDINGCENIATVTVTVHPLPIVVANADNNTICLGESVTLTGSGAVSYVWDNGVVDGTSFIPTKSKMYTMVGIDSNGCKNTASIFIAVKPLPIVLASTSNTSICLGESVRVTGKGAVSYVWDHGVIDGELFTPTKTNTYTVEGTGVNGCINIATVTIMVNPLPTVIANTDNTSVCLGESVLLTGSGAVSYIWDNGIVDGATFIPTETKTYRVVGKNAKGCENSSEITITVNPLVEPLFIGIPPICSGEDLEELPLVSTNNISGTWLPELDNTQTTTYVFTPNSGQCVPLIKSTITIQVYPIPDTGEAAEVVVCDTSSNVNLFEELAGTPDVGGVWTNALGQTLEDGYLSVFKPLEDQSGIYMYTITSDNCGAMSTRLLINVINKPIIKAIDVVDFSSNNTITIQLSDSETYQYSIDGFNFQKGNTFENVIIGDYTVYVKNECFEVMEDVEVCGAPKFFTPNNDGENDTWQVVCFENDPSARVTVFDRFGKVIKTFSPSAVGWNGMYIGELSPSTDYWFVLEYTKNDVRMRKKGHFSLIRRGLE